MEKPEQKKETRGAKPGNRNAAKPEGGFNAGFSGRCFSTDKAQWVKAAQAAGMKLNPWIIETLNKAAADAKAAAEKDQNNLL